MRKSVLPGVRAVLESGIRSDDDWRRVTGGLSTTKPDGEMRCAYYVPSHEMDIAEIDPDRIDVLARLACETAKGDGTP